MIAFEKVENNQILLIIIFGWKMELQSSFTAEGTDICLIEKQPLNASEPIDFSEEGKFIWEREMHPSNALTPIEMRDEGSVTFDKFEHL